MMGEIIPQNKTYKHLQSEFENFIGREEYPCVGARAALHSNSLRFGFYGPMKSKETAEFLAGNMKEYIREAREKPSTFLSYIAMFPEDKFADELSYEGALWELLINLHEHDRVNNPWDHRVSSNPEDKEFSYSFGNTAFFMVGMHPRSSRRARRFKYPSIAFNLHEQFEHLRETGRFERMKRAIRKNERQFDKTINPMLKDYGKGLEAPQYSGRNVGRHWKCPLTIKNIKE